MTEKNASPSSHTSRGVVDFQSDSNRNTELEFSITVELSGRVIVFVSPNAVLYSMPAGGDVQKKELIARSKIDAAELYHTTCFGVSRFDDLTGSPLLRILFQRYDTSSDGKSNLEK